MQIRYDAQEKQMEYRIQQGSHSLVFRIPDREGEKESKEAASEKTPFAIKRLLGIGLLIDERM